MIQFRVKRIPQMATIEMNKISVSDIEAPFIIIQKGMMTTGAILQYGSYTLEFKKSIPKPQTINVATISAKKVEIKICISANSLKTNSPARNAIIYIAKTINNDIDRLLILYLINFPPHYFSEITDYTYFIAINYHRMMGAAQMAKPG